MNQMIQKPVLSFSAITLAILSCSAVSYAEQSAQLEEVKVVAGTEETPVLQRKVGQTVKSASQLKRQQVQDNRDLVRYETGITVVEAGRFGASGYAIRGVDENRVAITVDGLRQAETLSSQGFKELFEGYGNFNNTRNSVEVETLKKATIQKGSDSLRAGSGALGGAVMFETKDARDFLIDKDWAASYKKGYTTADNQHLDTITLAGRYRWFDALLIKTKRDGHELENYGYKSAPDVNTRIREKADPYQIEKDSTLVKLAFSPTENHRFSAAADLYENTSKGQDLSYSLNATRTTPNAPNSSTRHTNDSNKRQNYSFTYENFRGNTLWDTMKITYSHQKIKNKARTDDYCDADSCQGTRDPLANPLGLGLKDGKVVDKEGNPVNLVATKKQDGSGDYTYHIVDSQGKPFTYPNPEGTTDQSAYFGLKTIDSYWFDCSIFDCTKDIEYYELPYWNNGGTLSKKTIGRTIVEYNGKQYSKHNSPYNLGPNKVIVTPNSLGYLSRSYHDRELNTNTRQLDLDFTKQFSLSSTDHQLSYGASLAKTRKEMVNLSGFDGTNMQWWATRFLGTNYKNEILTCETASGANRFNGALCPTVDGPYSFLIPVITKNNSIYLIDNFTVNNYLSFDLGYRYDRIKYKPDYQAGVSPKIPDGMIDQLFVPFVKPFAEKPELTWRDQPSLKDYNYDYSAYNIALAEFRKKQAEITAYNKEAKAKNEAAKVKNLQDNFDYFTQNKKYNAHSYSLAMNIDPTEYLRFQVRQAKGFRAPTSDELYFTFKHPDFTVLPNLNLKEETSKTTELALTYHGDIGYITTNVFQTKYNNFIDLGYIGSINYQTIHGGQARAEPFEVYQNVNRQNAKVKGFEISSKLYLEHLSSVLAGFNASYKFTYQKGRMEGNIPMNAIQPKTAIYGLGYDHKSGKFGIDLLVTHVSAKQAKDTYNMFWESQRAEEISKYPNEADRVVKDSSIRWRSNAYTLVDIISYAKPIKNLTLQFGVYNLTNRKYITWDSARSIRPFGTSNLIDQRTGTGINRFNAPGRNFKLSAELSF